MTAVGRAARRLAALAALAALSESPVAAQTEPARPDTPWRWDMGAWTPERQQTTWELHYAPVWYRPVGSGDPRWPMGFEVGFGARTTTRVLPFLVSWSSEPALRVLDSKSFALSVMQRVFAGLALGPIEPELGAGLSTLTVDVFHGNFSAELFSPRAEAGLWVHLGKVRVGAHAYGEYLWRWLGNRDYLLRGVAFELSLVVAATGRNGGTSSVH